MGREDLSICTLPMSRKATTFNSSTNTSADFCDITSLICTLILCDNNMPSSLSRRASLHGQLVTSRTIRPGAALTLSFCCLHHTTHSHSQLGYRTGASRGSEHVHHGAPSVLSWRGIVFDKAHSVVLSSTRMTHGVEGLAAPSPAERHTLLLHTSSTNQI